MLQTLCIFVLLHLGYRGTAGAGLLCYQCGAEGPNDWMYPMNDEMFNDYVEMESCYSFEMAYSWGKFVVQCKEGQLCGKTVRAGYTLSIVRACVERNDSVGLEHSIGCGSMSSFRMAPSDSEVSASDEFCVCDKDYCNSAEKSRNVSGKLLVFVVFLMFLFLYRSR